MKEALKKALAAIGKALTPIAYVAMHYPATLAVVIFVAFAVGHWIG